MFKICLLLKENMEKSETKRITSKILKTDEKNQHGNAVTKPLPYSCM